jgi:hypothetical protein
MLRYIVPMLGLTLLATFAALYVVDTDAYLRALPQSELSRLGIRS